jgi:hypothetical protein
LFQIFLVLWYWYFMLLITGALRLVYRAIQLSSGKVR